MAEHSTKPMDIAAMREDWAKKRLEFAKRPITGERFWVPRSDKAGVDTILYRPKRQAAKPLPVLFNLHGGGWLGGDAVLMDSFCALLAEAIPALIVNVNYTKIDVQPFPYQHEEVADAVRYFAAEAEKYGIDKTKFAVGGHSAGAHISAGVAMKLKEEGFALSAQMLVYPFLNFTQQREGDAGNMQRLLREHFFKGCDTAHRWLSPLAASDAALGGLPPAIIITCGPDTLKPHGTAYAKRLIDAGVPLYYREYPEALHGFLEVNRPEYEGDERRSPEQLAMTRDCEKYLIGCLRVCFGA